MSYNKGYRCLYSLNIHLVLVTKYRRKVINKEILQRLHEILASTCTKWSSNLTDFNGEADHVHAKPVFWTGAYFVATCGGVTIEQIKQYVENQTALNN
jgi:putative transposase